MNSLLKKSKGWLGSSEASPQSLISWGLVPLDPSHPMWNGRVRRAVTLCVLLLLVCPALVRAQAPVGHIASIYPAGGQQGQTVRVTVLGTELDGADGLRVAGQGVKGKVLKVDKGTSVAISVTIGAKAQPGVRDLRLLTKGGVTNRARFVVGQLVEVVEAEPNSEVSEAQALPKLPTVANGQIMGADKDRFRFSAVAGQTIVCRVEAQQLVPFIADAVPGWFQPVLTLYDDSGVRVAYADDFRFHPDPVLIYEVGRSGDYVIEIRDSIFRGREDFVYRLTVGELPYLTHIYPLGGQRKTKAKVAIFGPNLPTSETTLDLSTPLSLRKVRLQPKGILTNALPFAAGETGEIDEAEPNNTADKAVAITSPVTINGRIEAPGDVDYFTFEAAAEERLTIDVQARRLDSPLDSKIVLQDANGRKIVDCDDWEDITRPLMTHHADSLIDHTFAKAGKYAVKIYDIQGKGGQEYAYRLTIGPPTPDFLLRATPDNPRVGQGATTVLTVSALRRDGFSGPIELSVEDLPPGFVTAGTVIAEGTDEVILTLTAPQKAPLGIYQPKIIGTATLGGKKVTRRAVPVEDVMQAFYYHHMLPTQEFLLTVVEPGPFKLIPQMPEGYTRFGAGRTAFVTIKSVRKPQAKGIIRLTLQNPPKGVTMKGVTIPAGKNEAQVEIRYQNQLPGNATFNLIVSGSLKVGKETLASITPAILALGPSAKLPPSLQPAAK